MQRPMTPPYFSSTALMRTAKISVSSITRSVRRQTRSRFPAALARATSGIRMPDKAQRMVDGKNSTGITMPSNVPNCCSARLVLSPNCRSVIGISVSFAVLSAAVRQPPNATGTARRMYVPKERLHFPRHGSRFRTYKSSSTAVENSVPAAILPTR